MPFRSVKDRRRQKIERFLVIGKEVCWLAERTVTSTLVERHSRFLMLIKVPGKETEAAVTALSRRIRKLPATLRSSLTWDRGLEMAKHKEFTVATNVKVYFCDPQSPRQRGTNENTHLLLRQYFPRGTDLSPFSQAQLDQVSLRLNQRPRKTLGFQTLRVNFKPVLRRPSEPAGRTVQFALERTFPVTGLSRNFLIKDELVRAVGRGGPPFF